MIWGYHYFWKHPNDLLVTCCMPSDHNDLAFQDSWWIAVFWDLQIQTWSVSLPHCGSPGLSEPKKSSKIGGNCRLLDTFHSLSTGPNSEWTTVTTSTVGIAICKNTWHFERRAFPYRIFVRDECTCKGKQRAQKHNFPGKVTCERYKKNTPQLPKNDSSQTLPAAPIPFNHYLAGKSLTCDVGVGAVDRWLRKGMRPRSVAGDLWSWDERWEGNRVSKKTSFLLLSPISCMSFVSFLFLISRPVWCWFISDYHCSAKPPKKKTLETCTS